MLALMSRFAGWKVLSAFLTHPSSEFYTRQLSRDFKISLGTAQAYAQAYAKEGILALESKGNLKLFRLNNELPLVKSLKRTYFLALLEENKFAKKVIEGNPGIISMVLYGSYASGEYDEKSDIDMLMVSDGKIEKSSFLELGDSMGKEIQVTEATLSQWIKMRKTNDSFAASVVSNYVLLYGARL